MKDGEWREGLVGLIVARGYDGATEVWYCVRNSEAKSVEHRNIAEHKAERDQWSRLYKSQIDRLAIRRSRVTGLNGWDRLRFGHGADAAAKRTEFRGREPIMDVCVA